MVKARVAIRNLTRRTRVPRFAYAKIAQAVLPGWGISLVFVGPKQARELNTRLRKKTYIPNVLSYRLGMAVPDEAFAKSGEIFICLTEAEKQAPQHGMEKCTFVLSLFIHGLLHIKGWAHGGTMERCEKKLLARFARSGERTYHHATENSNRH